MLIYTAMLFKSILLGEDNGHPVVSSNSVSNYSSHGVRLSSSRKSPLGSYKIPIVFGASIYLYHFGMPSPTRYINLAEANAIWFSPGLAIHSAETKAWFENYTNHESISICLLLLFLINLLKQVVSPLPPLP